MSKKPQSKDEALEALDFIVNVLKEHEKDLDRLISELGTVTEQLGETGELNGKVERVEEKIGKIQNEVSNLLSYITKTRKETPPVVVNVEPQNQVPPMLQTAQTLPVATPVSASVVSSGPSIILRCKQWEDFQALAHQAQTISFMYKEAERSFQVDALKGNQIITYSGELPKFTSLLKMWLSKQLETPEMKILEGVLAIG